MELAVRNRSAQPIDECLAGRFDSHHSSATVGRRIRTQLFHGFVKERSSTLGKSSLTNPVICLRDCPFWRVRECYATQASARSTNAPQIGAAHANTREFT